MQKMCNFFGLDFDVLQIGQILVKKKWFFYKKRNFRDFSKSEKSGLFLIH